MAFGVAYAVSARDLDALDAIEGPGYERHEQPSVALCGRASTEVAGLAETELVSAISYVPLWVEKGMRPYDWYFRLMIAGARQHGLPAAYISALSHVTADPDLDVGRPAAVHARRLLASLERPDEQVSGRGGLTTRVKTSVHAILREHQRAAIYEIPCATMASATLRKAATLAPMA